MPINISRTTWLTKLNASVSYVLTFALSKTMNKEMAKNGIISVRDRRSFHSMTISVEAKG
jgi:hypothetical protein